MKEDHPHKSVLDAVAVRSNLIATRLLDLGANRFSETAAHLLVLTVDFDSDLYYAPITNIKAGDLAKTMNTPSPAEAIEKIRNNFPISTTRAHLLAAVFDAASISPDLMNSCLWFKLKDDGRVDEVLCHNDHGDTVDIPSEVQSIADVGKISPDINGVLSNMRNIIMPTSSRYLLVRPDIIIPDTNGGRRCRLGQVGIAFLNNTEHPFDPAIIDAACTATGTSSLAAFTLFYEKERYFQKAVRHAVKGRIVKTEPAKSVRDQIAKLGHLRDRGEHYMVPIVLKDGNAGKQLLDADMSWYLMPRYDLRNLLELLALTPGLQPYEVRTLARSAYRHMRDTYWGPCDAQPTRTIASLLTTAGIAKECVSGCVDTFSTTSDQVATLTPVKLKRGYGVFAPTSFDAYRPLVRCLDGPPGTELDVVVKWGGLEVVRRCLNPRAMMDRLINKVIKSDLPEQCERLRIRDGVLHGDAHFGNILVDAGMPEDPLIVTIDQATLSLSDPASAKALLSELPRCVSLNEIREELQRIEDDPTYDVAKMILSTFCCYGLMLRRAFNVAVVPGDILAVHISQSEAADVKHMGGGDGISGADVLAVTHEIPEDAFDYHREAGEQLLREFIGMAKNSHSEDKFINIALIRLWFLSLRHVFSISASLFPSTPEVAIGLFAWGTLMLSNGEDAMKRLMQGRCNLAPEDFASSLFEVLRSEYATT